MPKPIKAILCDVDGTFIDSFNRGLYKLRLAAEAAGYEYTEELEQRAVHIWGAPLEPLLEYCFPDANKETIASMVELFIEKDREQLPNAIEGVHAVFEFLASMGMVFTIVTSRESETLDLILKGEKLEHHFIHIASADTVEHTKPDPRVFACTMRLLGEMKIGLDECLLIGDTYDDFRAGQAFGMRTVIVRTGPLRDDREDIPAEDHITSFGDLPDWLARNGLLLDQ